MLLKELIENLLNFTVKLAIFKVALGWVVVFEDQKFLMIKVHSEHGR